MEKARNDLSAAVPKFCLALEEHRRTPDGRVRTSQEFLAAFFPHEEKTCTDRVFKHLPNEVRGPIIAAWGVRGIKSALRDNDEKVQSVVHDALVAGDIDHVAFEDGLGAEMLVRWVLDTVQAKSGAQGNGRPGGRSEQGRLDRVDQAGA